MSVSSQLVGFEATSDFSVPEFYPDDCGETAFSVIEHVKDGMALTGDAIAKVRDQMAALGLPVKGGTTMGELVQFFTQHRGMPCQYVNGYGASWDAIHQTLLDHAGRDGVVLEVELAYKLTQNEPGVRRHFIAIGGIHPVKGYLVANGDTLQSLAADGGHGKIVPCFWLDKNELAAAVPSACAIVTGLPHQDISPAALALPQARVVEGSITPMESTSSDSPQDTPRIGDEGTAEQAEADGAEAPVNTGAPVAVPTEQPATEARTVVESVTSNVPSRFLDASNVASLRSDLLSMCSAMTAALDAAHRILSSLPN